MSGMTVFWHPDQLAHAPRHFLQRGQLRPFLEVPARAESLLAACRAMDLPVETARAPTEGELRRVHAEAYLTFLRTAFADWGRQPDSGPDMIPSIHPTPEMLAQGGRPPRSVSGRLGWFTADTSSAIAAGTALAAQAAAGVAVAAAEAAAAGRPAYALTRPPGHHAYSARAGGHCYLNNAALAAEALLARGATRVAVLDIDSHHGNGTQGVFWERSDVLFVSVHADPDFYYPWYTGRLDERGGGAGEDATLNLPLPLGTGDGGWLAAIGAGLDAARRFGADALVVSLGFDASEHEPLRALAVTEDGFARAGAAIAGLRLACVVVQEGGYNVGLLGALLRRFCAGLLDG